MKKEVQVTKRWDKLREFTNARIALGSVGTALPLSEVLALKEAHAMAKDAITRSLDKELLRSFCIENNLDCFDFKSQAKDRLEYLKRPDLGRKIFNEELNSFYPEVDIVFVITDGLSASAVNKNVSNVLKGILTEVKSKYSAAVAIVDQGRVAIGDYIANIFKASFVVVFIGERPGLSSPESMGIYTTYKPEIGITDERRNCISNIHANGLSNTQATYLLIYLIEQSYKKQMSGVNLKIDLAKLN